MRIFGSKREKGAGDWRRMRNKVLHNLYHSSSIIRVKKSRWMTPMIYVEYTEGMGNACSNIIANPEQK
jgi:hypothetical protein